MASKKDKLIESAQKFITKGQLDRAIRDYEEIVALDSGDIRQRQKLAELLVRVNRKDDAIAEYEAISKQYSGNHFYLKAIAVYKQIQKLDPANIRTTLTLASLNEKQGLTGNALAEYNVAVNHYLKAGSLPEAINVIEKMLAADPENLNTHLKCAETYFTAGNRDKAFGEFTRLALLLCKRGDDAAFKRVCERVKNLYPDKDNFPDGLLSTQDAGDMGIDLVDAPAHVAEAASEAEANAAPPEALLPTKPTPAPPPEPPPVAVAAPLPAEPPEPPQDLAWEEEIDLCLLEDEGMSFFQDDTAQDETLPPGLSELAEELPQENGVDFSTLEIDGLEETDYSEAILSLEIEVEETSGPEEPFDAGEPCLESVDLSSINTQIEALRRTPKASIPESAQTESAAIPPVKKKRKYDLDGQLNDFKRVLDDQIDKNDTETHYSLGIAYKEMCLFDDAINEFQTASQDPQRRIDCLTLEGVCYRDKGDYAKAEEVFNNTLSLQELAGEEIASVRYELAILFEAEGRQEEALHLYRQVQSANPGFRDAAKKIALLRKGDDAPEQAELELLELDVEELE